MFTKKELGFFRYILMHYIVSAHEKTYLLEDMRKAIKLHDRLQEVINDKTKT